MDDFYKGSRWKKKRIVILKRDEYRCQECKRYGKTTAAKAVHHIIPLTWCLIFDKLLALASMNLISLCDKCHDKMHNRANNKLTELGLSWVRKMGKVGLDWIDEYSKEGW